MARDDDWRRLQERLQQHGLLASGHQPVALDDRITPDLRDAIAALVPVGDLWGVSCASPSSTLTVHDGLIGMRAGHDRVARTASASSWMAVGMACSAIWP